MGFLLKIPTQLLEDSRLELVVWTPEQWAEYVESLRIQRRAMDMANRPRAEKVKLTWQIKKAAAFKPTRPFLRFKAV